MGHPLVRDVAEADYIEKEEGRNNSEEDQPENSFEEDFALHSVVNLSNLLPGLSLLELSFHLQRGRASQSNEEEGKHGEEERVEGHPEVLDDDIPKERGVVFVGRIQVVEEGVESEFEEESEEEEGELECKVE